MKIQPQDAGLRTAAGALFLALALAGIGCGGTDDLTPQPEPRPYEVNGLEDCTVFPSVFLVFEQVSVEAGTHTLRLEASDYADRPDSAYASHLVCGFLAGEVDSTSLKNWCFTLNGVGDEQTVSFAGEGTIHLGYIGTVPLGNRGSSVVSLDATRQFEITAAEHSVTVSGLTERFIAVEVDSMGAGTYEVALAASDFSPRAGLVAPLVVVHFFDVNELARDHLITTLNGPGDRVAVHLEPGERVYAGFFDDLALDNTGGADLTISFLGP